MLNEAEGMNPGPWVDHVRYAARAAETIARELGDMDAENAYILALLHDIGRRTGRSKFRHMIDGYRYLEGLGYPDAARVCITHGFPIKDIDTVLHEKDVPDADWEFARKFLASVEYDDYDSLVQLADIVSMPHGYVLIDKRFVDVALRYGTTAHTAERWRAFFAVRDSFERRLGKSVYTLLPGVVENTFGFTE
jgi:putative nucleotidyltransferase with HDIG domain